jgi:hypothetical protein
VQIGVRTPRADRMRCARRGRGRFVQTTENPAGSPGAARGRVLLCKLIVKTCPQITLNGPVSASSPSTTRRLPFLQTADAARSCQCAARRTHAGKHCPSRARGDKNSIRRLSRRVEQSRDGTVGFDAPAMQISPPPSAHRFAHPEGEARGSDARYLAGMSPREINERPVSGFTWHGVDERLWSKAGPRYSSRIGPRMALSRRSRLRV